MAPPDFKQLENVDDWVSKIVYKDKKVFTTCYDGSVQTLQFTDQDPISLKRTGILKCSSQPLTHLVKCGDDLIASGYDGRTLLFSWDGEL